MANILKTIVFRSNYGGLSGGGILQSLGSQKSFAAVSNVGLNSLINCRTKSSTPSEVSEFKDFRSEVYPERKRVSKFDSIQLSQLHLPQMREGILINTVQKILKIYERNKDRPHFSSDVDKFVKSKDFTNFCASLNKKMSEFSPLSLIILLELEVFIKSSKHPFILNLYNLILDNFNKFSLLEVVHLYNRVAQNNFCNEVKMKNIMRTCDMYFKKRLPFDLDHVKFSPELLDVFTLEYVPESVKKSIAKKLVDESFVNSCNQKELNFVVNCFCQGAYVYLPSSQFFAFIKKCVYTIRSHPLFLNLLRAYKTLLLNDDSFYDEDICSLLTVYGFDRFSSVNDLFKFISNMCVAGYYRKDFVDAICNQLVSRPSGYFSVELANAAAIILVRYSFHESEPEENVKSVRRSLEEISNSLVKRDSSSASLCAFLTYLGCDMRQLCNYTFATVTETFHSEREKDLLTLHHLAKAYFLSDYQDPPEDFLDLLLLDEFQTVQSYSFESLGPYFSSQDYVLKNCTTAGKHCLHFVCVLGPDNKPINLSKYRKRSETLKRNKFLPIEDIHKPPGSKVIAFQIYPHEFSMKFLNEPRMCGIAKMYLKTFENADCSIVLLPAKFFNLKPEAKAEFLRTQINEITENYGMSMPTELKQ